MYTTLARIRGNGRSVRSSCFACHKHILHNNSIYHQSRPHGRPPSLLPSTRRPSVRSSRRAHTTYAVRHRKLTAHYPHR
jgi:hypothetical protein